VGRGPGRRPGNVDTRGEVLAAARTEFAERGYDGASVRGIARAAGVDPSLVHHYFGSKEQLFVATMHLPAVPADVLPQLFVGDADRLGERVVRFFLSLYAEPSDREPLLVLLRSAMSQERAAAMLRGFFTEAVIGRVAAGIDAPDRQLRASVAASHLIGVFMLRYVVGVPHLAEADDEQIVALVGPSLQRYLTGD
jgi:AcrR family transcriptional regulator